MTVSQAGALTLTIVPNAAGRKQLATKRTIHLKVQLAFSPTGGQTTTGTVSITWHRK